MTVRDVFTLELIKRGLLNDEGQVVGGVKPAVSDLRVFVEGDSRAETTINKSLYGVSRLRDIGIPTGAAAYCNGAVRIVESNQVGGTSSTQIADRLVAALPTVACDEVWIPEMGVNNMHSAAAATYNPDVLRADTLRAAEACLAAGKILRIGTIRPVTETFSGYTPLLITRILAHRAWMLETLTRYPNVRVLDTWAVAEDDGIEAGAAGDGIHINQIGAQVWGKQLAESVATDYTLLPQTALSNRERWGVLGSNEQLNDNPLFTGSGGTNASGLTGTVPAGNRLTKSGAGTLTGTSQIIQATDGRGAIWRLTVTNTSDACTLIWRHSPVHTIVAEGQVLEGVTGLQVSGGAQILRAQADIYVNNLEAATTMERSSTENLTLDQYPQASVGPMVLRTGRTAPIGAPGTQCEQGGRVQFAAAGGAAVIDIWLPRLRRIA